MNVSGSSIKVWLSAARPRTLPLSISGILIGSSYSFYNDAFNFKVFLCALLTTLSYQVLSNFANDYGDGVKGSDDKRIGPKRAVQSGLISRSNMRKGVFILSFIASILTFLLLVLSFEIFSIYFLVFFLLGGLAIFAAIKYTVGRFAYGYHGLGDFFVFVFFGLVSVLGSNFLFDSTLSFELISPAIIVGVLSVGVLNLNNMRDLETDAACGKKTLAVYLGPKAAKIYHLVLVFVSFILMVLYPFQFEINSGFLKILYFLNSFFLIFHFYQVYITIKPKEYDLFLKFLSLNAFLFSVLVSFNFSKILI